MIENGIILHETDNKMINNLIKKLIKVNVEERCEWDEYFEDEFFKVGNDEIEKEVLKNKEEQIIKITIEVKNDNDTIKIFHYIDDDIEKSEIKLTIVIICFMNA